MEPLNPTYDHQRYEEHWYEFWQKNKLFHSEPDPNKKPYTILMPPPNVTSQLHMGHGTGYSFQDLLIRWKRMLGYNACWLPGTDHAGIATQMMVEKDLQKTGETRQQLGREEFVRRCESWRLKYGGIILDQFRKMGFSCDWDRVSYTMDEKLSEAVRFVFVQLFESGHIYRGERLVNWDTQLQTAVSDDEVENKEVQGHIWHFRYPMADSEECITIATTRPETMLGDTAVAVHPEDERFKHLIGKKVRLPFTNRLIPIIADDYVKSEFGTGAVKITPAHDPNDFEIGKRHKLPFINILCDDGSLNEQCPEPFRGQDRFEARKQIIQGLKELGLFEKVENYKTTIPHSERSKTIIEPKLSQQWFVRMADLARPAADAARNDDLRFHPDAWKKTYLYWLDNVQDWCISRQLWWGHRVPIWHCEDCKGYTTGMTDPSQCHHCQSSSIRQDEDVLDTWFSSWLWPLSPFGWPDSADEKRLGLDYYYPSDVLVTATEIIFLWVARMIMVGLKFKGEIPFKDVFFNATVCDKQGRKFSKTLGNGIDPLEVIERHGADAVRYTAVTLAPLGGRIKMSPEDFENGARFVNKVWNAARFLFRYVDESTKLRPLSSCQLNLSQKWIISRVQSTADSVNRKFGNYRLNDGVEDIYHLVWTSYCDWTIEAAKEALVSPDREVQQTSVSVLVYVFDQILRFLHPVMPFVTEELWQRLPQHPDLDRPSSISVARFPEATDAFKYETESEQYENIMEVITIIRSLRNQAKFAPRDEAHVTIQVDAQWQEFLEANRRVISELSNLRQLDLSTSQDKLTNCLVGVGKKARVFLHVEGRLDIAAEKKRLNQELQKLRGVVTGFEKKLSNKDFVDRAPEEVIIETKAKHADMQQKIKALEESLQWL
jgi:valyl-tRNA synthetase